MKRVAVFGLFALIALLPVTARADVIDFESGYNEQDPVGVVTTLTNSVTFSATYGMTVYVAKVGAPAFAFANLDTPAGGNPGNYFLTDEQAGWGWGYQVSLDYFMSFDSPVTDLSVDLYDYLHDYDGATGYAKSGDTATLTVYSDFVGGTVVGQAVYTIPDPNPPNGNVVTLSVLSPSDTILAASLTFSALDFGTGIDNITFSTYTAEVEGEPVPEPATLILLGSGLLGLGAWRRRRLSSN